MVIYLMYLNYLFAEESYDFQLKESEDYPNKQFDIKKGVKIVLWGVSTYCATTYVMRFINKESGEIDDSIDRLKERKDGFISSSKQIFTLLVTCSIFSLLFYFLFFDVFVKKDPKKRILRILEMLKEQRNRLKVSRVAEELNSNNIEVLEEKMSKKGILNKIY